MIVCRASSDIPELRECSCQFSNPVVISPVALATSNLEWYTLLMGGLAPEQTADIQRLFVAADQRKAASGMHQ